MSFYGEQVVPRIVTVVMNTKETRKIRARVCADLGGNVVEIGFGSGLNLPYLSVDVKQLQAVEPSAVAVKLAGGRIAAATVPVEVVGLDGQLLALPDNIADSLLCTWSLCTIPNPAAAVAEMARVLRPGGYLHFVEHGLAPDPTVQKWQRRLNGVQRRIAGGCHLNRDIPAIIKAGGMTITALDANYAKGEPKPFGYFYEGVATAMA